MKDERSMKLPVSPIEGSRFAAGIPAEKLPLSPSALASRVLPARFAATLPEESMVVDDRSSLSPAQMVENKLINRLRESSLPVSHLQMRGLVRNRYEA
jgi:hypothetical protein